MRYKREDYNGGMGKLRKERIYEQTKWKTGRKW